MFVFFILAVIGGVIGGVLAYRNDVQLQNASICQFNSYENVVLLESDEPNDVLAYLKYRNDKNKEMNFKWHPINTDVDEVFVLDSLYQGQILKVKFMDRIVRSGSRESWREGFVYKGDLMDCKNQ